MAEKFFYLVRHGEAEGNVTGKSQDMQTPLTPEGHRQAMVIAERASNLDIQKMYTSDMKRAVDTGAYIGKASNLVPVATPLLREWMTPVSVRGKTFDSPEYQKWILALDNNYSVPEWRYEDAENFHDLQTRAAQLADLIEKDEAESILAVSHGKFMRLFLTYILNGKRVTPEIHLQFNGSVFVTNTGISVFSIENGRWKLITWNDHAHFAEY